MGKRWMNASNRKIKKSNEYNEAKPNVKLSTLTQSIQFIKQSPAEHYMKINNKSRNVKKNKTPAQDRLQKITKKIDNFEENVRDTINRQHTDFIYNNNNNERPRSLTVKFKKSTKFNKINRSIDKILCNDDKQSTIGNKIAPPVKFPMVLPSKYSLQEQMKTFRENVPAIVEIPIDPSKPAYIVPDTNVFLDSLAAIKCVIEKDHKYSIMIPSVVLQELDSLKKRKNEVVSMKATFADRYIHDQVKNKNYRMLGQKAIEDKDPIINVKSDDDRILNCCLQLKNRSSDVILLTNDINLSTKARLNDIEAITSCQYLKKCP